MQHDNPVQRHQQTMTGRGERRIAAIVAIAFVFTGLAWVLVTDIALYRFVDDPVLIARFETAKGWVFVAVGAALVYAVALRTARKLAQAEATLSAVLDSIGDGLLLLDRDQTICRANEAAERMLRSDDLRGMGAPEFSRRFRVSYPNGALVRPENFVSQRAFREPGPLRYKALLHPPGGTELVVSVTAAAVRPSDDDQVRLVVSVMHDITAAEHLEQLRDRFFAAAAHTLKTPVAIIKANAQALLAAQTPGLAEASRAIDRQCARIDRLVQNLLVLSRVRSESLELFMQVIDLAAIVERVTCEIAARSPPARLRLELGASPRIHGDGERLALVLRNLIEDAERSAEPGSPVTVSLTESDREAIITVCYRHMPAPDSHPAAGDEFDDQFISRAVTGSIVHAHNGQLREEHGRTGASAWVSLPVVEGAGRRRAEAGERRERP